MNAYDRNAGVGVTIAATAMLGAAVCASLAVAQPAEAPQRDRYLLLDSGIIESTDNARLTVGTARKDENNPLFKEDKPWEPRFDNPYCSVIYDQEDRLYKCGHAMWCSSNEPNGIAASGKVVRPATTRRSRGSHRAENGHSVGWVGRRRAS